LVLDLNLPQVAATQGKQIPQRLTPVGGTKAAELSLLKLLLAPIRMVEKALVDGKYLFQGIKEQLGDAIVHDVAPSRFHTQHKVRVRKPKGNIPSRSPAGEPWWLASHVKIEANVFDDTRKFSVFMFSIRQDLDRMSAMAEGQVARIYGDEERRLRRRLGANIKATYKVDPNNIWSQADVKDQLEVAVNQSVSLIKGMTDDLAKKVEFTILDAAQKGQSTTQLSERLKNEMGISRDRARLIARDQVSSLNAALTKARQKQMGLDQYIWHTAQDERVRHAHRLREGKVFSWDNPPEDGHPGEPINCRCVAIGLVTPKNK
jgi:SPP1 gp7 family putative phage head morphogenesis protein